MLRFLSIKIAVTLQEVAYQFSGCNASAHQILHEKIGMIKVHARWLSKQLTEDIQDDHSKKILGAF